MKPIRIAGVEKQSIVDGKGLRYTIFTQGCPHACPGCHNPHTHDFDAGEDLAPETVLDALEKNPLLAGITLSGGEPLCQPVALLPLARAVKAKGGDIWCYTGFTLEQLLEMQKTDEALAGLLAEIDVLVDGPYIEAQRDLTLQFRGSRNQRVLDLPATLSGHTPVLLL